MSTRMDVVELPLKKRPKKVSKKKTDMVSRSKILNKINHLLQNEQCRHMLFWADKLKKEFIIKLVHMNNPEFKNADYLELFKELDKLSNNYEKYLRDKKYNHNCKVRCKANLRKLVESGALTFMGKTWKGKSIQLIKYKLNFDGAVTNAETKEEFSTLQNQQYLTANSAKASSADANAELEVNNPQVLQMPNAKREVSKSEKMTKRCSVINIIVNMPVGGASILSVSPIEPSLLGMCCSAKNGNEDTRIILQKQPMTVFEHEKQMDENICVLPTDSTECLNKESMGKFTFPNCTSPIREAMEVINLAGLNSEYSENSEMSYNNNSPNEVQIGGFQDKDNEIKNFAQLVPCSPQMFEENTDDIFSQCFMDYNADVNKPLQQDNDPFLSDRIAYGSNDDLLEDNEYPMANNEDLFSFENSDDF